jgi:hypothetical protein
LVQSIAVDADIAMRFGRAWVNGYALLPLFKSELAGPSSTPIKEGGFSWRMFQYPKTSQSETKVMFNLTKRQLICFARALSAYRFSFCSKTQPA